MPFRLWPSRSRVPAADFQAYLMDQVVATFPTESARRTSIRYPKVGQLTWLDIPGGFQYWDGEKWTDLGPLLVSDRTKLPEQGRIGMTAIDAAGQYWEWRNIGGVEQWTWPRAGQGILWWQGYIGTIGLAAPSSGAARLSAFDTPMIYIPAGRRLSLEFACSTQTDAAGAYAFVLTFGQQRRRGVVENITPGIPVHHTIRKPYAPVAAGEYQGWINGGRYAGSGNWSLVDVDAQPGVEGIDGQHQFVISDVGSI
jgi:hypothetical protein